MIKIMLYDDSLHRKEVINLWTEIFNYKDARNNPAVSIDKKLANKDDLFFVAADSDKVIGTIMAGYDGHRGWIYSLAVVPELRMNKIGSKLLNFAEDKLKKLGCLKINLQIISSNEVVKEFYLKNGYKVEKRISMGKVIDENIP